MKQFDYMTETYVDEIPPMSIEWELRELGIHHIANKISGPSWLDRIVTRTQKRNLGLIPEEIEHILCERMWIDVTRFF